MTDETQKKPGFFAELNGYIHSSKKFRELMHDAGEQIAKLDPLKVQNATIQRLDSTLNEASEMSIRSRMIFRNKNNIRSLCGAAALSVIGVIVGVYAIVSLFMTTSFYAVAVIMFAWCFGVLAIRHQHLQQQLEALSLTGMHRSVKSLVMERNFSQGDDGEISNDSIKNMGKKLGLSDEDIAGLERLVETLESKEVSTQGDDGARKTMIMKDDNSIINERSNKPLKLVRRKKQNPGGGTGV